MGTAPERWMGILKGQFRTKAGKDRYRYTTVLPQVPLRNNTVLIVLNRIEMS